MKVLMLGWEYPPHISGGLGTACEGLTIGLSKLNIKVKFIVPELIGSEKAEHMTLLGSSSLPVGTSSVITKEEILKNITNIEKKKIPAFLSPYWNSDEFDQYILKIKKLYGKVKGSVEGIESLFEKFNSFANKSLHEISQNRYSGNMYSEVDKYAENVLSLALQNTDFDIIHAHDWMTFPAAIALSGATQKPLVVHIHSLEYDRSGKSVNPQINDIERMGLQYADHIIAVSHYTKSVIIREHGISEDKISVVHNGVYGKELVSSYRDNSFNRSKIVLFLGRVTFQKGPDYFVEAASKVIPHVPEVIFVMAGSGDMLNRMIERVNELNLQKSFHFPGFLKGEEVEQMFSIADLYVMPSVSEPFGISALESISYDTPVLISRQSGVSEVLNHALKFDFWDVDHLADLIVNGLIHHELRDDMVNMAREEVKRLRWDVAANKIIEVYSRVIG